MKLSLFIKYLRVFWNIVSVSECSKSRMVLNYKCALLADGCTFRIWRCNTRQNGNYIFLRHVVFGFDSLVHSRANGTRRFRGRCDYIDDPSCPLCPICKVHAREYNELQNENKWKQKIIFGRITRHFSRSNRGNHPNRPDRI